LIALHRSDNRLGDEKLAHLQPSDAEFRDSRLVDHDPTHRYGSDGNAASPDATNGCGHEC
jgi:hypothetical protein